MSNRSSLELSTRSIKIYSGAADAQARADIAEHVADNENPHGVTAGQVGLGAVDNTSDTNKPVSGPQAAALSLKAPLASPSLTGVPTAPTAAPGSIGGQVATVSFVQAAITAVDVPGVEADLAAHIANHNNPHAVDAADIGLGSVDNTADAAKPVSALQQAAINAAVAPKANLASPPLTGVPTAPTAAVGTSTTQIATTAFADAIGDALTTSIGAHTSNVSNPHSVTKSQVGLGAVDNTSDANKPVSTATQTALNLKAPLASPSLTGTPLAPTAAPGTNTTQIASTAYAKAAADAVAANVTAHAANVSNPHSVTKSQIGLGAVDNTSDAAKPVSTATATALALKAPLASPPLTGVPTAPTAAVGTATTQLATTAFADAIGDALTASLTAHAGNVSNPHSVTKSQVGLGAVDNTSDAAKPVSTATATALALKANLASPALTGTPTAPTAAPGTATTQVATTQFVDLIGDALRASIEGASDRPGDAVALYGTLATGTPAAMPRVDPTWVATSAAGNVVRVNSVTAADPQIIAPTEAFTVGPISDITWTVQRQTDPIDPLNDSVTLAVRWLTNTYAGVAGAAGTSTVANLPLVIANGIVTQHARIGGGGLVPPAGAVYFRPYVQLFGNNHVTDVIVLGVAAACSCGLAIVTLLAATTALPAGTTGLVLASPAAAMTVTLPPSPVLGQTLTVKDAGGTAATRPITIAGGAATIEGQASLVLAFNYSWVELAYSGTQWLQI